MCHSSSSKMCQLLKLRMQVVTSGNNKYIVLFSTFKRYDVWKTMGNLKQKMELSYY